MWSSEFPSVDQEGKCHGMDAWAPQGIAEDSFSPAKEVLEGDWIMSEQDLCSMCVDQADDKYLEMLDTVIVAFR